MIHTAMTVLVLGALALAVVVDVAVLIGFLRRRIGEHAERSGP
jgi:hypothetical protein